jgi:hypothetical protein
MAQFSNADEIAAKIQKLFEPGGEGYDALVKALEQACIGVEGSAKRRCPARTSHLRNSITHRVEEDEMLGHVFTAVEYAPYVEIGTGIYSSRCDGRKTPWIYTDPKTGEKIFTRGSHPHPYMKPAVDNNISAIEKCFEGII